MLGRKKKQSQPEGKDQGADGVFTDGGAPAMAGAATGGDAMEVVAEMNATKRNRLDQSLMLEEQGPGGLIRLVAIFIVVLIIAFIVWATTTQLSEVVVSSGEVAPAGSVKRIQHLEGGIIEAIHVQDGTLVDEGDLVVTLAASTALPKREQLRARLAGLQFEANQLRAIITGKDEILSEGAGGKFRNLASSQLMVLQAKRDSAKAQLDVIDKQIAQRGLEKKLLEEQIPGIQDQITIIEEQLAIRRNLLAKGLQPKLILLDNERELARVKAQLVDNRGEQRRILESVQELISKKAEISSRLASEAAENLGKINTEIAEIQETIRQVDDQVERLKVRAPVRGFIQNLRNQTLGGVVKAGETIAEVIPTNAELIVESRISTDDIGFIFKGQKASIKVQTYDYTQFGEIGGTIEQISATTVEDEAGMPHYLAYIKLDKNYVGANPERNLVVPGMTVLADIRTGQKSLTEYLAKPVYKAFTEAFRER